jgi:hypothetical protein
MKKLLKLDMKHQLAYNESDATIVKPLIFCLFIRFIIRFL